MAIGFIAGATGFIGSHFIRYWLDRSPGDELVALAHSTSVCKLIDVLGHHGSRCRVVVGDICHRERLLSLFASHLPDFVVNFAAESRVRRVKLYPDECYRTNVLGTQILLDAARTVGIPRFHQVSTSCVYGDAREPSCVACDERAPFWPQSLYGASKVAADITALAYHHTFGMDITVSHACNTYGSYQLPDKVIPCFIIKAITNRRLPLFNRGQDSREFIHVSDHCSAIECILRAGKPGERYNVGSGAEIPIGVIADTVLDLLGKEASQKLLLQDEGGSPRQCVLDSSKMRGTLGWKPKVDFYAGLQETVRWYEHNALWWRALEPWPDEGSALERVLATE